MGSICKIEIINISMQSNQTKWKSVPPPASYPGWGTARTAPCGKTWWSLWRPPRSPPAASRPPSRPCTPPSGGEWNPAHVDEFCVTQQARTWKVLRISLRDFWSIFPLILIKTNQLTPLLKKSYHSKFFMFFQVVKFTFWYGISMNLKVMLLIIKQIESCKKLQKLNFWPYLDDF